MTIKSRLQKEHFSSFEILPKGSPTPYCSNPAKIEVVELFLKSPSVCCQMSKSNASTPHVKIELHGPLNRDV